MPREKDITFLVVRKTGKLGLRINIEGLTVNMSLKMTPEQKNFHDEMMSSSVYQEIITLFAQQGANLRGHEKWSDAVEKGANAGDTILD